MGFILDLLKDIPLSAVLKEKLSTAESQFRDSQAQVSLLEGKAFHLECKITELEAENAALKAEVQQADLKCQQLEQQIEDLSHKPEPPPLDETHKRLLAALFRRHTLHLYELDSYVENHNRSLTVLHLRQLEQAGFVILREAGQPRRANCTITDEGTAYALKTNLVSGAIPLPALKLES